MELKIKLFATLKDRAGQESILVNVTPPVTVYRLLAAIEAEYPALKPSLPTTLVAVNKAFSLPGNGNWRRR